MRVISPVVSGSGLPSHSPRGTAEIKAGVDDGLCSPESQLKYLYRREKTTEAKGYDVVSYDADVDPAGDDNADAEEVVDISLDVLLMRLLFMLW
ncbi:hypothetical protein A2U01_0000889 [Trifolium medium]|uniref:Uncharacterized protein n=1 Tax=Trifolium medium TaxID=97028 RepID=A0A392LYR6_9FABA|nr:hypothetical protein [Trifolium medium]